MIENKDYKELQNSTCIPGFINLAPGISLESLDNQERLLTNSGIIRSVGLGEINEGTNSPYVKLSHEQVLETLLNDLKRINFQQRAALAEEQKLNKKHFVIIAIEAILSKAKEKNWSLCMSGGEVFIFNCEYWNQLPKDELLNFLGKAAEKVGVGKYDARYHKFKQDLLSQFLSTAYLPKSSKNKEEVLINLINGTYVISSTSNGLRSFREKDFLTYQLPFSFIPGAGCTIFDNYIERVLPNPDQQKILAEFVAYVFISHKILKLEKSMILHGSGANGKSVFFEIILALLGRENVSNYSLQSLTNGQGYQRAKLSNKLMNYASEISANMDSTLFKQMVSGEPIEARLPYGEPFILEDYAKLIFNTNELPRDVEQNEAFFRRFLILNFDVTIPETERDPELARKIISSELPGIFNWVLRGLQRLLTQRGFTFSQEALNAVETYKQQSDSIHLFLVEEAYQPSVTEVVALKFIYTKYKIYCQESGYKVCSLRVFADRMRNKHFNLERRNTGTVVYAEIHL